MELDGMVGLDRINIAPRPGVSALHSRLQSCVDGAAAPCDIRSLGFLDLYDFSRVRGELDVMLAWVERFWANEWRDRTRWSSGIRQAHVVTALACHGDGRLPR